MQEKPTPFGIRRVNVIWNVLTLIDKHCSYYGLDEGYLTLIPSAHENDVSVVFHFFRATG